MKDKQFRLALKERKITKKFVYDIIDKLTLVHYQVEKNNTDFDRYLIDLISEMSNGLDEFADTLEN